MQATRIFIKRKDLLRLKKFKVYFDVNKERKNYETKFLQNSSNTLLRSTVTIENLRWDAANFILIIPCELFRGFDLTRGEECNPWETQVMGVDENVLNEKIWIA